MAPAAAHAPPDTCVCSGWFRMMTQRTVENFIRLALGNDSVFRRVRGCNLQRQSIRQADCARLHDGPKKRWRDPWGSNGVNADVDVVDADVVDADDPILASV
jgi:hypothetical protein